jgi:DNA primase
MARIPEEEIERIKREISLERLVLAKGVKRHGADLLGLCPFHDDHEPSLVISPEKNLWHCLGACQAGGSVIDWVMKAEGVSYRHALELLKADIPSLEAFPSMPRGRQQGKVAKKTTVAKLPTFLERGAEDEVLLRQVVDYYHETLKQSPEALEYLQKRGLHNSEMLTRFRLGFANRTLAYRLPLKNRQAGAELRGRLQKLGILRDTGHEHFRGVARDLGFRRAGTGYRDVRAKSERALARGHAKTPIFTRSTSRCLESRGTQVEQGDNPGEIRN